MKSFDPIATLKKYKFLIIGVSLLMTVVCFSLLSGQQSYTATAIIEYTNDEAEKGKAPDGTTIDPSEIYSSEVMKQVFERMDMDYGSYNLDKFRSKVVVKEILTDEQSVMQTALNEKGEAMTTMPTKYSVSITLDESHVAQPEIFVRRFLENLLDVYLSVYGENHVSSSIIVNNTVKLQESDFDYIEAVEAIDDAVSSTMTSLSNTINYDGYFRSTENGYAFEDLYREFEVIADHDIPNLYAYILNNKITKNADVLVSKYRQRVEEYNIDNEESLRQIRDIEQIIAAYVEMMRQSDNTNITYEYILDEVYDGYYQDKTKGGEGANNWHKVDETIEYEVLLESYIDDRTDYEYALIEIAFCQYIIDNYSSAEAVSSTLQTEELESADAFAAMGAPVAAMQEAEIVTASEAEPLTQEEMLADENGEPLAPIVGFTGDAAGAQQRIDELMARLDALYAALTVLKTEYNAYYGASNVGLITNIVVKSNVQVMLYTLLLTIVCLLGISAAVIFLDRFTEILHYHIYMDGKFLVGNRNACDRYLARHDRAVLPGETVCIALNVTDLHEKNKNHGREKCDQMMIALAAQMKRIFPKEPACFIALNAQGQFVVFMEGMRAAQAQAYMEYINREAELYNEEHDCPMTYRYGIAEAEADNVFQLRALLVCAVNKANGEKAFVQEKAE